MQTVLSFDCFICKRSLLFTASYANCLLYLQTVLIIDCFICKLSLLCTALYTNCLYYVLLYLQSVLIIYCFICKLSLLFTVLLQSFALQRDYGYGERGGARAPDGGVGGPPSPYPPPIARPMSSRCAGVFWSHKDPYCRLSRYPDRLLNGQNYCSYVHTRCTCILIVMRIVIGRDLLG